MSEEITGTGTAQDAAVVADENPDKSYAEATAAVMAAGAKAELAYRVSSAQISVEKIKAHLAQAEQNLADALAEQEGQK